ncbi:MAG: DUF4442 domain-containing protein [Bacteroidales bacterium]|nr:MAG: DUF4442 domain-containing protein [Bacteroidales bacterium]
MNVLDIPFNKFIGLQLADSDKDYLLKLDHKSEYLNHLGSVHASALFALAEASSGEFLLVQFKAFELNVIPVVRKVEVKYSKPVEGAVYSKACFVDSNVSEIVNELRIKKRVTIKVRVDIMSGGTEKVLTSFFEWFVAMS